MVWCLCSVVFETDFANFLLIEEAQVYDTSDPGHLQSDTSRHCCELICELIRECQKVTKVAEYCSKCILQLKESKTSMSNKNS